MSGKDPSKVDRSGAYAARKIARDIVSAGYADMAEVQIAYAIGVAEPVSLRVDSNGTGVVPDGEMAALLRRDCDLTPAGIIRTLDLRRPIYSATASQGHFGMEDRPWERTDLAETWKRYNNIG